jgi:FlaA1/EpsC-like NDP-sugar epimerase
MLVEGCLYCGSADIVKHGHRFGKATTKQLSKCNSCGKIFSEGDKARFPQEVIDAAVAEQGKKSLAEIQQHLQESYGAYVSKVSIAQWHKKHKKQGDVMGKDFFKGKRILITGGTGTIGKALAKELLTKHDPEVVRLFDVDETDHFEFEHELHRIDPALVKKVRFLLGDVKDKQRLAFAFHDVDIVFHLAALKHVKACEYNPFEAVKTNIIGTQNVVEAALENNVERVIYTSSDKAANPNNTMGATKLVAERLITSANYYKGGKRTVFASVRFGNVMGSRGSVIPLFKKQIANGGPVTVTDPGMTRFTMSLNESVRLVLDCAQRAQGGEIFILKMPVIRLSDFTQVIINEIAPKHGKDPASIKVETIGLKEGESMYEELMTDEESARAGELKDMFVILPLLYERYQHFSTAYPDAKPVSRKGYESKNESVLTKDEIKTLLHKSGALE